MCTLLSLKHQCLQLNDSKHLSFVNSMYCKQVGLLEFLFLVDAVRQPLFTEVSIAGNSVDNRFFVLVCKGLYAVLITSFVLIFMFSLYVF